MFFGSSRHAPPLGVRDKSAWRGVGAQWCRRFCLKTTKKNDLYNQGDRSYIGPILVTQLNCGMVDFR